MTTLRQDRSEFNVLFVHSELDDYGLSANEFRIYAHLAKCAATKGASPSIESISKQCGLTQESIGRSLIRLHELNLLSALIKTGGSQGGVQ